MGHIDTRVNDVMDATADAPGANDDGSGTALMLEVARVLSKEKFAASIVYAALSGEEQGLFGGTLLAETAKERGWQVTAVLNNRSEEHKSELQSLMHISYAVFCLQKKK